MPPPQGNLLAGLTQKGPFRPESPPSRSAQALPASPTCLLAQQPFTTGSAFPNKTWQGSPCRSLVLGGLCPGQYDWQPWPTCTCLDAFLGARNPTAERRILGIWRGSEPPGGPALPVNCCVMVASHSSKVGTPSPQAECRGSCGWGRGGPPLALPYSLPIEAGIRWLNQLAQGVLRRGRRSRERLSRRGSGWSPRSCPI